jgi:hypothetical protein
VQALRARLPSHVEAREGGRAEPRADAALLACASPL